MMIIPQVSTSSIEKIYKYLSIIILTTEITFEIVFFCFQSICRYIAKWKTYLAEQTKLMLNFADRKRCRSATPPPQRVYVYIHIYIYFFQDCIWKHEMLPLSVILMSYNKEPQHFYENIYLLYKVLRIRICALVSVTTLVTGSLSAFPRSTSFIFITIRTSYKGT